MILYKKVEDVQKQVSLWKEQGYSVGFVPTMGALHEGHLSLIDTANAETDKVICSIFVNPTQFNEKSDFETYPRNTERDIELLLSRDCAMLFLPEPEAVYPEDYKVDYTLDFGMLDKRLEGAFRPGHFDGVAEVVKRLLDIVRPDVLFLGQKDYQQFLIVQSMIEQLDIPVKLQSVDIVREPSGLARSSRNERLSKDQRQAAALINETLVWVEKNFSIQDVESLQKEGIKRIDSSELLKTEYLEMVDAKDLAPLENKSACKKVLVCAAVWAGEVRLIDNRLIYIEE